MTQDFIKVSSYLYSDLEKDIRSVIIDYNDMGFYLAHIHYVNMEDNDGECHAFMLFNKVERKAEDPWDQAGRCCC